MKVDDLKSQVDGRMGKVRKVIWRSSLWLPRLQNRASSVGTSWPSSPKKKKI